MNTRSIVLGVGCAGVTLFCHAADVTTNLLEKSQLKQLDKNKNGILEYRELEALPKAQCEAALDAYDINSDGEITSSELERAPRTKESMAKEEKQKQQEKQQQKQQVQKKQQQKKPAQKKPAPKKPAPKPDPKKKTKK